MKRIAILLLLVASTLANRAPTRVYSTSYNIGARDTAYGITLYRGDLVIAGPTTSPPPTGFDFFALRLRADDGSLVTSFGQGGVVKVDFGNTQGSRTDIATDVVVFDDNILLVGESVLGPPVNVTSGSSSNLSFTAAMLNNDGDLVQSFGQGGLAAYKLSAGINCEAFCAAVDGDEVILMGFTNPTLISGANRPFNTGVLKIDRNGNRVTSFGTNGQVIVDHNDWDERARGCLIRDKKFVIAGRAKPTPEDTNFRATLDVLYAETGMLVPSFGGYEYGFGRSVINGGNGSLDIISVAEARRTLYSAGNWGGWDEGASGNKAIAVLKYEEDGSLDRSWAEGGIQYILPVNVSYDVYKIVADTNKLYVVGGAKENAASASPAVPFIATFPINGRTPGIVYPAPRQGARTSFYRTALLERGRMTVAGEVTYVGSTSSDVLVEQFNV